MRVKHYAVTVTHDTHGVPLAQTKAPPAFSLHNADQPTLQTVPPHTLVRIIGLSQRAASQTLPRVYF